MAKPRVVIADTDAAYVVPLQLKMVEDYFDRLDLEIITSREYFDKLFSTPQNIDILIISDVLYSQSMQRHSIGHTFVMTEEYEEEATADLRVNRIFKYTSIKEIFNEIRSKSGAVLPDGDNIKKEPQIVLVYSATGGVGKTTVAMGLCACLIQNYKRVLYINASCLQTFQYKLENTSPITGADIYVKLGNAQDNIYNEIKHVLRKEAFTYLPPFKAALMSLMLKYSVFGKIALSAKRSNEYDFIVVDADSTFDEDKAQLMKIADKVLIVTEQTLGSVCATNVLVDNINGMSEDKFHFICNNFSKDADNALISPNVTLKFTANGNDYINHFPHYDQMKISEYAKDSGMQKVTFLVI